MTNFTGHLVNYHFITLNYLTTNSFFMHMHQLQKQHSLPQTRLLTSAMLNGYKIPAVQNTLHVPCTLTCTTDQSLLTTQPFTCALTFSMPCTAHSNLITPHPFTNTLLCTYYCFVYSSFVYCHFVYLQFLHLFAVVTHTFLKFNEKIIWNTLAIHTSIYIYIQLFKSHQITKCTNMFI